MPIIPNYRGNTQVNALPTVRDTTNVPAGPDVAGAIGKLGGQAVDQLEKMQQKRDLAGLMEGRRKLAEFENNFYDPENPNGIAAYKGRNALGANEAFKTSYGALKGEIERDFNPNQQAQWSGIALQFEDSNLGRLNAHMTRENDDYLKQEFDATAGGLSENYARALVGGDNELAAAKLGELQGLYLARARTEGLSETAVSEGMKKLTSGAHKLAAENLMLSDPLKAEQYINDNDTQMTVEDSVDIRAKVMPYVDDQIARQIADQYRTTDSDGNPVNNPVTNYVPRGEKAIAIKSAADALGIDATELATYLSYETKGTFDPDIVGPTTKWGQHRGLIQWGEPQAQQYGYKPGMPFADQMKSVVRYLKDRGVKPGMSGLQVYAAINGGNVNAVNASDAKAGGRPGTVRDKVAKDMDGHRAKARAMFGVSNDVVITDAPHTEIDVYNDIQRRTDPNLNPRRRELAMQHYRSNQAMFDRQQADNERQMNEELARRMDQMKPGQSARDALGPLYAYAAKKGRLTQFENNAKSLIAESEAQARVKTNPLYEDSLIVMATDNPKKFMSLDLSAARLEGKLSASDYARYSKMQKDFADPKKGDDTQKEWRTDSQRVGEGFTNLFPDPDTSKMTSKKKAEHNRDRAEKRRQFETLWGMTRRSLSERGKLDDPAAVQGAMDELVRRVARNPKLLESTDSAQSYGVNLTGNVRQQGREAYKRLHGVVPTENQLIAFISEARANK